MKKIIEFQKENGLVADGIIGKKTLLMVKEKLGIPTIEGLAHFMGQIATETGNFEAEVENLNYSAEGLLKTFKKYFTKETALAYERKPDKIANRVYANRMGNGDEASQDGSKFKGRGALQLTGKINFKAFSNFVGEDCVEDPALVSGKFYFQSAKFFFDNNNLWKLTKTVDDDSITKLSKAINLGSSTNKATPNGLEERLIKTKEFYKILTK